MWSSATRGRRACRLLSLLALGVTATVPAGLTMAAPATADATGPAGTTAPARTTDQAQRTARARATAGTKASTVDHAPPTVVGHSPGTGTKVSPWARVTATMSEEIRPSSLTARFTPKKGPAVPATVAFDPRSRTAVVTPDRALTTGTAYTVRLTGGTDVAGNVMAPASFRIGTSTVAGCPSTLWQDNDVPAVESATSSAAAELGLRFRADRDGYATGIRFYKGAGNTGTHIGRLWGTVGTNLGQKLAQATFAAESASGWQQVTFAPVRLAAGKDYVVSYYAPAGHYSYSYDYFATSGHTRAPLTAPRNGDSGGNNVYLPGNGLYTTGFGFPAATYRSTNYWVDVVFDTPATDSCPATIFSDAQSPAASTPDGTPVEVGVKFRSDRDGYVRGVRFYKGPANTGTHVGRLWSTTGTKLAEATFVAESGSGWQQALFTQPVQIPAGTTYVVSYLAPAGHYSYTSGAFSAAGITRGPLTALRDGTDGGNGVYAYRAGFPTDSYRGTSYGVDVLFGTVAAPACPCSIWPAGAEPGTRQAADASGAEVGVRWRPLRDGWVTGLRFYKGEGNTGTHTGRLWSNTGTRLAEAQFSNETASGWQQVTLAQPVAVSAGTTYVASYYAPAGHYAVDDSYFAGQNTTGTGPLVALADGVGGPNGVFRYGAGFPTATYRSFNYWVDVVTDTTPDTTTPVVVAREPGPGASTVAVNGYLSVRFSEPVIPSSIAVAVTTGGTPEPGSVSYDSSLFTARFIFDDAMRYGAGHSVTVSGARDPAGNVMVPVTWDFTTLPDPAKGPGGPIAVITGPGNPYAAYYAEILRAEGLNEFGTLALADLDAGTLSTVDVAILADPVITDAQAATLTTWVNGGGKLIAMRPDQRLAGLLGLSTTVDTMTDAYVAVDPATPPGAGITDTPMQYHGTADRRHLAGATLVAELDSNARTETGYPAVTMRNVGANGGRAGAFLYDLARSIVLTRQGNPAWAGTHRDGVYQLRSDDMFYGGAEPDWVDLTRVAVPQADEQQRLLANMIEYFDADTKPLPRFWYFPGLNKAALIPTGDDEVSYRISASQLRFDTYLANSQPGCDASNWECARFSSYLFVEMPMTDAQARAYTEQGFEVALHPENGCRNPSDEHGAGTLDSTYVEKLGVFGTHFPSLAAPTTSRFHCVIYPDFDSQPAIEFNHGIRMDENYYYWPPGWVADRPGFMTGSGMPMRMTDRNGRIVDVYQGATQLTDESGQTYPYTPDTLLDNALGARGFYGWFIANMHPTENPSRYADDQLLASALRHHVPIVTSRAVLNWLDTRAASSFTGLSWSGGSLSFEVRAAPSQPGLTAMLPTTGGGGTVLATLSRDGTPVTVTRMTIKGIEYAMFPAAGGSYTAGYVPAGVPGLDALSVSASLDGTATVSWTSTAPGTSEVLLGTSVDALTRHTVADRVREHTVTIGGLTPGTTYHYRVESTEPAGGTAGSEMWEFTTPVADRTAPVVSGLRLVSLPDGTVRVSWHTDEPSTSVVSYGTSTGVLDRQARGDGPASEHIVVLTDVDPSTALRARVSSTDMAGNTVSYPPPAAAPTAFVTAPAGVAEQTSASFHTGSTTGALVINGTGLADLTVNPAILNGRPATGMYVSHVLSAVQPVQWQRALWDADVPAGATVTVSVRTGDTVTPDGTWSGWTPVAGPGSALTVPGGQYLQYRVRLAGATAGAPVLHWIGFTHDGPQPGADIRSGRAAG